MNLPALPPAHSGEPHSLAPGRAVAIGLIALWLIQLLLVNPSGDFPLNDDWSYARGVRSLVETGRLDIPPDWASMTLVLQLAWGALFCLPAGFSHLALRLSTLTLGLVAIFATHRLLRECGIRESSAALGAALVALNPLLLCVSCSFMTDIPFMAVALLAVIGFVRFLRTERNTAYLAAIAWLLAALMIRQTAVTVAAGFGVAYLAQQRGRRSSWVRAALPFVACIGLLFLHQTVLSPQFGFPNLYGDRMQDTVGRLTGSPLDLARWLKHDALFIVVTLGAFLVPVLPVVMQPHRNAPAPRAAVLATAGVALVLTALLIRMGKLLPLGTNYLGEASVGPLSLRDSMVLGLQIWPPAPQWIWWLVTAAAVLMGAHLVVRGCGVLLRLRNPLAISPGDSAAVSTLFLLATCVFYLALSSVALLFDRYLTFVLPLVLAIVLVRHDPLPQLRPAVIVLCGGLLLAWTAYGVAGTHDYFQWNRARWQACDYLTQERAIPVDQIDGGFEFCGQHCYTYPYTPTEDKSWWWVKDDRYLVTFGPVTGYQPIRAFPFRRWMPPGQGVIYALERQP